MHIKKLLSTLLLLSLTLVAVAQVPNWQWAKDAGGPLYDGGSSIASDVAGNVYVTGWFYSPTITFGSTTLTTHDNDPGQSDIFVVKYDGTGNVLWAENFGGYGVDIGTGICIAPNGNVFITGYFRDTIVFGADTLLGSGFSDVFVTALNSSGIPIWAKKARGISTDGSIGICTDSNGNVLVTGIFTSPSFVIGNDTLINHDTLSFYNGAGGDIFVAKYDGTGNLLWAKRAGEGMRDVSAGISSDGNNVLVTGYFESGYIVFGTDTLNTSGGADVFVTKYDANGNVVWAKSAGGTSTDRASQIATDSNGNVFVTGYFGNAPMNFGTNTINTAGGDDIFIAKYDPSGNVVWAKSEGGSSVDYGLAIHCDVNGNVILGGAYGSSTITFGSTTLTNVGGADIFIVNYDTNGNAIWAKTAGGIYHEYVYGITSDPNGNIFITGYYSSPTLAFGNTTLTNSSISISYADVFVAALNVLLGIDGENNPSTFQVCPNPFSSSTIIKSGYPVKNATLTIYNLYGQSVKQMDNLSGQTIVFQRDNLPSGIYFLRLTQDNKVIATNKIVITDK